MTRRSTQTAQALRPPSAMSPQCLQARKVPNYTSLLPSQLPLLLHRRRLSARLPALLFTRVTVFLAPVICRSVFNTLILAFLCGDADGPRTNGTGVTQTWAGMTADQRQEYKAAGITILVSLFGWTAKPTSSKWDSTATANMMADWVMANGVDGIDVDYEGTVAMDAGLAEAWVASFTTQLRNRLPSPTYILTHAPMALWWSGTQLGGGYRTIDQTVGGMIDWYNVQFYNAGQQYVNCTSLVQENPDQTALLQINTEGKVPLNKLVLGKPATNGDGGSYTDITTLNSCIQTAKAAQWDAGIMFWKYGDNATEVMTLARKGVFP
ncbi:chitinase [Mycena metata]|uniref:Chitinase n=1 Tax=Mycena metata TaxID=1033252 RepID=A0AAD7MM25_9AGAR|nr:chitinase [Mycena metata]